MACCSYSRFVGGACGSSVYNPANFECVVIETCNKAIKKHLRQHNTYDSYLTTEAELLLVRAGIFDIGVSNLKLTVCPRHRDAFGTRWRCNKKSCASPSEWAPHRETKMKADRGITSTQSHLLYRLTSTLVPVSSPICKACRNSLSKETPVSDNHEHAEVEGSEEQNTPVLYMDPVPTPSAYKVCEDILTEASTSESTEIDWGKGDAVDLEEQMGNLTIDASLYTAEDAGSSSASDSDENQRKRNANLAYRRLKLNEFLIASDKAQVRQPKKKWEELSTRTKNKRILQAKDGAVAVLEVVAPEAESSLWEALKESRCVEKTLDADSVASQYDEKYLKALAEAYENAEGWDTRRQILSIIADLAPYHVIQKYIPGITAYRIKAARHHRLEYGRGSSMPGAKSPRMRVDSSKLDHFISFMISPHVVQDLPSHRIE